jgi:hypothetical protein
MCDIRFFMGLPHKKTHRAVIAYELRILLESNPQSSLIKLKGEDTYDNKRKEANH